MRDSIDASGDLSNGTARAEYVNKLLVELNAAKREVVEARAENREERNRLVEQVAGLEDELQATKLDLEKTRRDFLKTREGIAKREFEDALTIQRLEEEAELAQAALRDASLGKLPRFLLSTRWRKTWLARKPVSTSCPSGSRLNKPKPPR